MKSTFYASLPLTFLLLLFSCRNGDPQNKNEKTEPQQDILVNQTEVYIHSIEFRRFMDVLATHIIDVNIVGLKEKEAIELTAKYNRCKLTTPDDSIYVDMFLTQNDLISRIRFHNCCFLKNLTKNEIHAALKKARITFYNDSTKCEIFNSEELIETAYTEIREGLVKPEPGKLPEK